MHGSKKELNCWFRAIWWLVSNATVATARGLQRELGFAGYQTAWTWMNKLRSALSDIAEEKVGGTVAVGSGELPDGSGILRKYHFLMAVESIAGGRLSGMVRMACVDSVDGDSVSRFIRDHVRPGSVVVVPERGPFISAAEMESYLLIPDGDNSSAVVLEEMVKRFRSWYGRRKYQPVNRGRLQEQLDEFCFTQTALLCRNKKDLFDRVLMGAVGHGPREAGHET